MKYAVVINNSIVSRRSNPEQILLERFGNQISDLIYTDSYDQAKEFTRTAVKQRIDTIIVAGGDGTINSVLNGIIGTETTIGIIPAGSANDLANYYHIPSNYSKCCDMFDRDNQTTVDVMAVNNHYFLTTGGVGLPAETIKAVNSVRSSSGMKRVCCKLLREKMYLFGLLSALFHNLQRSQTIQLKYNNISPVYKSYSIIVGILPYLGRYFYALPNANNQDCCMDVYMIRDNNSRFDCLKAICKTISGNQSNQQNVTYLKEKYITIASLWPIPFFGDGEILEIGNKFQLRVIPQAVKIIIP
jgi:YegS/Rv2252/BmrU family lipid kinase